MNRDSSSPNNYERLNQEISRLTAHLNQKDNCISMVCHNLATLNGNLAKAQDKANNERQELSGVLGMFYQVGLERDALANEVRLLRERIVEGERNFRAYDGNIQEL